MKLGGFHKSIEGALASLVVPCFKTDFSSGNVVCPVAGLFSVDLRARLSECEER